MEIIKEKQKQFKQLVSQQEYKHLKDLMGYACMDIDALTELESKLYLNLTHYHLGDNIRNAVQYAKVSFCKFVQIYRYDIYPYKYSDCILPDMQRLYKTLSEEEYAFLLKHFKELEDYEQNNIPANLKKNIFIKGYMGV